MSSDLFATFSAAASDAGAVMGVAMGLQASHAASAFALCYKSMGGMQPIDLTQAQVDATEKALKAREGGGGIVKGAAWVKGKRLDVKGGSKDTGGAAHMTKHYKPGDTSRREAAKDTHLGRKQKDRTEVASVGKKNKVILADKGDHLEPVTTRRKTDND